MKELKSHGPSHIHKTKNKILNMRTCLNLKRRFNKQQKNQDVKFIDSVWEISFYIFKIKYKILFCVTLLLDCHFKSSSGCLAIVLTLQNVFIFKDEVKKFF